jgi:nitroimidazol reductase NimA-like FMN-containing flavoprotein (pyridoxamine 5'-phosphate oxidase superfamily)
MNNDNVKKYANQARSSIRRTDRAIADPALLKQLLAQGEFGVLATTHLDQPFATPVNYLYIEEDHALYFHGAHVGRTRANLALNAKVCFNVSQMGALFAGDRISNFGVEYRSVTIFGTAAPLQDQDKIVAVLLGLMQKYFPDHIPGQDYPLPQPDELKRTTVYQIAIEEWSGKQLKKDSA